MPNGIYVTSVATSCEERLDAYYYVSRRGFPCALHLCADCEFWLSGGVFAFDIVCMWRQRNNCCKAVKLKLLETDNFLSKSLSQGHSTKTNNSSLNWGAFLGTRITIRIIWMTTDFLTTYFFLKLPSVITSTYNNGTWLFIQFDTHSPKFYSFEWRRKNPISYVQWRPTNINMGWQINT